MEIDAIKQQFKEVLEFSQGINNLNVDDVFSKWERNKKRFIDRMNGQLIYESPESVSFDLNPEDKEKKIDNFINDLALRNMPAELIKFISDNREGFFYNSVVEDYRKNGIQILRGMKLVRSFKYFIEDKELLHQIQDIASRIIQEDKIEGRFCVSVHPLDYLSVSENSYNWRSCHALDGDYRAGNLSYMADAVTLVCYIKGEEDTNIPMFPFKWNSKKWRMLLFINEKAEICWAGRQYPFTSVSALNFVKTNFVEKFWPTKSWSLFRNTTVKKNAFQRLEYNSDNNSIVTDAEDELKEPYFIFNHHLYKMGDYIRNKSNLHYNDLLFSSVYTPWFMVDLDYNRYAEPPMIFIGNDVKCISCGKDSIGDNDTMLCDSCRDGYEDDWYACECCGQSFLDEDIVWVEASDEYVCVDCFNDYYAECPCCGDYFRKAEMLTDDNTGDLLCQYCWSESRDNSNEKFAEYEGE